MWAESDGSTDRATWPRGRNLTGSAFEGLGDGRAVQAARRHRMVDAVSAPEIVTLRRLLVRISALSLRFTWMWRRLVVNRLHLLLTGQVRQ